MYKIHHQRSNHHHNHHHHSGFHSINNKQQHHQHNHSIITMSEQQSTGTVVTEPLPTQAMHYPGGNGNVGYFSETSINQSHHPFPNYTPNLQQQQQQQQAHTNDYHTESSTSSIPRFNSNNSNSIIDSTNNYPPGNDNHKINNQHMMSQQQQQQYFQQQFPTYMIYDPRNQTLQPATFYMPTFINPQNINLTNTNNNNTRNTNTNNNTRNTNTNNNNNSNIRNDEDQHQQHQQHHQQQQQPIQYYNPMQPHHSFYYPQFANGSTPTYINPTSSAQLFDPQCLQQINYHSSSSNIPGYGGYPEQKYMDTGEDYDEYEDEYEEEGEEGVLVDGGNQDGGDQGGGGGGGGGGKYLQQAETQSMPSLHNEDSNESDYAGMSSDEEENLNTVHGEDILQEMQNISFFRNIVNVSNPPHQRMLSKHSTSDNLTVVQAAPNGASLITSTDAAGNASTLAAMTHSIAAGTVSIAAAAATTTVSSSQSTSSRFKKTRIKERTMIWNNNWFSVKDNLLTNLTDTAIDHAKLLFQRLNDDNYSQFEQQVFGNTIETIDLCSTSSTITTPSDQPDSTSSQICPNHRHLILSNQIPVSVCAANHCVPPPPPCCLPPPPPPTLMIFRRPSQKSQQQQQQQQHQFHQLFNKQITSTNNTGSLITNLNSTNNQLVCPSPQMLSKPRKSLQIPIPIWTGSTNGTNISSNNNNSSSTLLPLLSPVASSPGQLLLPMHHSGRHHSRMANNSTSCSTTNNTKTNNKRRRRWSVIDNSKLAEYFHNSSCGGVNAQHSIDLNPNNNPLVDQISAITQMPLFSPPSNQHRGSQNFIGSHCIKYAQSSFSNHQHRHQQHTSSHSQHYEQKIDLLLMKLKKTLMTQMENSLLEMRYEMKQLRHHNREMDQELRKCKQQLINCELQLHTPHCNGDGVYEAAAPVKQDDYNGTDTLPHIAPETVLVDRAPVVTSSTTNEDRADDVPVQISR